MKYSQKKPCIGSITVSIISIGAFLLAASDMKMMNRTIVVALAKTQYCCEVKFQGRLEIYAS